MHEGAGYTVMEFVGGRSLKQILQDRRDAAGGVNTPLPVDQALAFVLEILPAFAYLHDVGPAVLRLQAGQRDPAGRRGQAHRPRRRAPDRRPGLGDLRHGRLPGARGGRGRAVRGVGHLHDRPHPGHAGARLPRQHEHLRGVAARRSRTPRCSRRTTRSTGCWPRRARSTRRTGSRRSTSCARRSSACCARSSPPTAGPGSPALHSAASVLFEAPTSDEAGHPLAWDQLPALKVDASDPAASWLAGVNVSDPAAAHRGAGRRAAGDRRGAAAARRPRRSRRASSDVRRPDDRPDPRGRPVGVAGGLAGRARAAEHQRPGRGARVVQRRLRAGARRAGAEARAGHRVRAERRAGHRGVALHHLRALRRQLHGPGRVRAGPHPPRAGRPARGARARSTWSPPRAAPTWTPG